MAVMLTCVLMWLGLQVTARAICLSFQIGQMKLSLYYFPTTRTFTGRHPEFERDYNSHTAFGAFYVTMHKVNFTKKELITLSVIDF